MDGRKCLKRIAVLLLLGMIFLCQTVFAADTDFDEVVETTSEQDEVFPEDVQNEEPVVLTMEQSFSSGAKNSMSSYFTGSDRMAVEGLPELLSLNEQTGGEVRKLFDYKDVVRTVIYAPDSVYGYAETGQTAYGIPGGKGSYRYYGVQENGAGNNEKYYNENRTGFDTYYGNGYLLRATLKKTFFSGINTVSGNLPRMMITEGDNAKGSWFGGSTLASKAGSSNFDVYYCPVQPTPGTQNPNYYMYTYWHVEVLRWNGENSYDPYKTFRESDYTHLEGYQDLFFGFNDIDKLQSCANESEPLSPSNTFRSPMWMFETDSPAPEAALGCVNNYLQTTPTYDDLIWFYNDYLYGDFVDGTLYQRSKKITTGEGIDVDFGFGGGNWAAMELYTLYYPVRYLAEEGGRITCQNEESVVSGLLATGSSQEAENGFHFTGWTADRDIHLMDGSVLLKDEVLASDEDLARILVDQPIVLTAHYKEDYEAEGEIRLPVTKELKTGDLSKHTFLFGLYEKPDDTEPVAQAEAGADGTAVFTIPVTSSDRGDFYRTYYVKEIPGSENGMIYDKNIFRALIKVTDNGDHTLSGAPEEISLVSDYSSDGLLKAVRAVTTGVITGDTFRLGPLEVVGYSGGYSGEILGQGHYRLRTGSGDADVGLAQKIEGFESGDTLTFSVRMKKNSGDPVPAAFLFQSLSDGVSTTPTAYSQKIPLTAEEDTDGWVRYTGSVEAIRNPSLSSYLVFGFSNTSSEAEFESPTLSVTGLRYRTEEKIKFVNLYQANGEAQITAAKVLEMGDIKDYTFSFGLLKEGEAEPFMTAENDNEGKIRFQVPYSQNDIGKTFRYSLREIPGQDPDIRYSEETYPVEVKVEDDGAGRIKTEVSYPQGEAVFTNEYLRIPSDYVLTAEKKVTGNMGDKETEFHFLLKLSGERLQEAELYYKKSGAAEAKAFSLEDGEFRFTLKHGETILFTGIPNGTKYEIKELDADQDNYVTIVPSEAKGSLSENQKAVFVNRRNIGIPTGVKIPLYAGLSLTGAGAVFLSIILFMKRRKKN